MHIPPTEDVRPLYKRNDSMNMLSRENWLEVWKTGGEVARLL